MLTFMNAVSLIIKNHASNYANFNNNEHEYTVQCRFYCLIMKMLTAYLFMVICFTFTNCFLSREIHSANSKHNLLVRYILIIEYKRLGTSNKVNHNQP